MFEAKQKANWSLCDGLSWLRCMVCFFSVDCPKIKTYTTIQMFGRFILCFESFFWISFA